MNAAAAADKSAPVTDVATPPLQRRSWVFGVGTAGAAALAVKALPGSPALAPVATAAQPAIETAGGYQVTAHVLRYYGTARA